MSGASPDPGTRVLLARMPVEQRLQIRRLLRGVEGITVAGQVLGDLPLLDSVRTAQAQWLITDATQWSNGGPQGLDGTPLKGCIGLLPGTDTPHHWPPRPHWHLLPCPRDLSAESPDGTFCKLLCQTILGPDRRWPATATAAPAPAPGAPQAKGCKLLAVGASTGGPPALTLLLQGLRGRLDAPILITQHTTQGFTASLAQALTAASGIRTWEAEHGMPILPGHAYVAPSGRHLCVDAVGAGLVCRLDDGPPLHYCRPAVDAMLQSLAAVRHLSTLAVILTGMGHDGLVGCKALKAAGQTVWAQDQTSSVVWGMPGAVVKAGLCERVLPLERLADAVSRHLRGAPC